MFRVRRALLALLVALCMAPRLVPAGERDSTREPPNLSVFGVETCCPLVWPTDSNPIPNIIIKIDLNVIQVSSFAVAIARRREYSLKVRLYLVFASLDLH